MGVDNSGEQEMKTIEDAVRELPKPGDVCEWGGDKAIVLARDGDFLWLKRIGSNPFSVDGNANRELIRPLRTDRERWVDAAESVVSKRIHFNKPELVCEIVYDALQSGELPIPGGDK